MEHWQPGGWRLGTILGMSCGCSMSYKSLRIGLKGDYFLVETADGGSKTFVRFFASFSNCYNIKYDDLSKIAIFETTALNSVLGGGAGYHAF